MHRTYLGPKDRVINKATNIMALLELLVSLVGEVKQENKQFWLVLGPGNQDNMIEWPK